MSQMAIQPPTIGAIYFPVCEDEVPYYDPGSDYDWTWGRETLRPMLTVAEIAHHYTVDGKDGGAPDGGFQILASDGVWYDCYWSYRHACWCYGLVG